ncbi:MAG: ATP-grasp domain-containing protein [Thermomicrobiales bacterium]
MDCETIAADCDVVGLLAVEFSQTDGKLLINEIATRPHNSGHFRSKARSPQFEQHLRSVLDLPSGSATCRAVGRHRASVGG